MFLKIENINITLGKFTLTNVDFGIKKGEYVTIIGPSGSGKSILLETVAGFYKPKSGKVYLNDEDITDKPIESRNISIVYQDYVLFPHMNVYENIMYGLKKHNKNKTQNDKDINEISKILKIDHLLKRKPLTLSGGEMQRVSIARALIVKPQLLLMDEAFSALDYKIKKEMRQLLKEAAKKYNTTVLHVTHDFEDVWTLADKTVLMRFGEVLQVGTPEEMFSKPKNRKVADFVGTNILNAKVIDKEDNLSVLEIDGFKLYSIDDADIGENVKISIRPEDIIVSKSGCEKESAKNCIYGFIEKAEKKGFLADLIVDVNDIKFVVLITLNSYEKLNLQEKTNVYLIFKASNVHIF
jgi:molybdate transport system ATP-binding protein